MIIFLHWLPDYLSLLETRYVLQWIKGANSWVNNLRWLLIDFFFTSFVWAVGLCAFCLLLFDPLPDVKSIPDITELLGYTFLFFNHTEYTDPYQFSSMGILLYSTYFTSIWVWLFLLSGWIIKHIFWGGQKVEFLLRFLDINNKPLRSMGVVSCILITIVFWTWVIAIK